MTLTQSFLAEVDSFLKRAGLSASQFGLLAMNDKNFIRRVRYGGVSLKNADRVRKFMSEYNRGEGRRRCAA